MEEAGRDFTIETVGALYFANITKIVNCATARSGASTKQAQKNVLQLLSVSLWTNYAYIRTYDSKVLGSVG